MNRILRFSAVLFLAVLMLLLPACTDGNDGVQPSGSSEVPETEVPPSGEPSPADGITYTVVYPDLEAGKDAAKLSASLRSTLKDIPGSSGAAIGTDWIDRGKTVGEVRAPHEILIGNTNRPESAAGIGLLCENTAQQLDYLIRNDGDHYVICASEGYLSDAVSAFSELIREDPSYVTGAPKTLSLSRPHVFGTASVTIAGRPIGDYTAIVYPDRYYEQETEQAEQFQTLIFESTGVFLPLVPLSQGAPDPAIRIGAVTDPEVLAAGPYSFSVSSGEHGVDICGRDFFSEWRGLRYLQDQFSPDAASSDISADYRRLTETGTIGRLAWLMGAPGALDNDRTFADCADCGFNIAILNPPGSRIFEIGLRLAEHELQGLWFSADPGRYSNTDICWGYYLVDEPNASMFPELARSGDVFRSKHPESRLYINMLPSQALPETMHCPTYEEFLRRYFDELKPTYASMDEYPLRKFGSDLAVASWFYSGLDIFAKASRAHGVPYGGYIQSVTFSENTRQISENDLRFQALSYLAFGFQDIQYYTYVTSNYSDDGYVGALVDRAFEKRPIWYGAQRLNRELAAMGKAYRTYECLGSFCTGPKKQSFSEFEGQYTDFGSVAEFSTDGGIGVGCFERNGTEHAFFCVNTADPDIPAADITVTVTLHEGTGITLWQNGEPREIDAKNGRVSFVLPTADGVFAQIR